MQSYKKSWCGLRKLCGHSCASPLVEDEEDGEGEADCTNSVVPFELLAEVSHGENGEDAERDDFLNRLELRCVEFVRADAVRGDLKAIFEESDAPAGENNLPERFAAVFEMAVPGESHEDVGNGEQSDGAQKSSFQSTARKKGDQTKLAVESV